jgi:hypothetical protein
MTCFALDLPHGVPTMDDVVRLLAVVGGAAIGGFVTGFLTQAIVRGYTGQHVPRWVLWTLRILGAVAMGWLVYLLVLGHGGPLWGSGGGGGNGKDGGGPGETRPALTVPKDGTGTQGEQGSVLRIAVLGDEPLRKLADAGKIKSADPDRSYHISDDEPANLRTLKEVEQYVLQRVKREPPLKRIEIVLYKDSPQKRVPRVAELMKWAEDLTRPGTDEKVIVGFNEPGEPAPVQ